MCICGSGLLGSFLPSTLAADEFAWDWSFHYTEQRGGRSGDGGGEKWGTRWCDPGHKTHSFSVCYMSFYHSCEVTTNDVGLFRIVISHTSVFFFLFRDWLSDDKHFNLLLLVYWEQGPRTCSLKISVARGMEGKKRREFFSLFFFPPFVLFLVSFWYLGLGYPYLRTTGSFNAMSGQRYLLFLS